MAMPQVHPSGSLARSAAESAQRPLVEVHDLQKHFVIRRGLRVRAVEKVTFSIARGEIFALVGESGSGKTTVGRTVIGLYRPTGGTVRFDGADVHALSGSALYAFKRRAQIIFQDPYASLNPRMTVGEIIGEALDTHRLTRTRKERQERIAQLLSVVGLSAEHAGRYPHEFSGGQRQRIGIARALAVDPEFVVADEPISALDVSIQAQVVNLLARLQRQRRLTYLFIAHDLSMVRHISDRVGVMYLGRLVETGPTAEVYRQPLHPYTQGLLSAVPIPDPRRERGRQRIPMEGEIPSPIDPPSGCPFRTRCPHARPICAEVEPSLTEVAPAHRVACHLY
ncbi:ABC transporter ATP-binding protein [Geochorda subterranea]|uniref:ABC transporter ATP-binding protein n=2 Tax=Geochorda subterranea TaxID=3109564 RepID=A0ABZ1BSB4_9FIRM|nr:ABC transporter ATP-binding protein [Limnochorda sp. LNt]WRP15376.1 ABC transporter ATP-binding protein [Limnochorda sp. LNt]